MDVDDSVSRSNVTSVNCEIKTNITTGNNYQDCDIHYFPENGGREREVSVYELLKEMVSDAQAEQWKDSGGLSGVRVDGSAVNEDEDFDMTPFFVEEGDLQDGTPLHVAGLQGECTLELDKRKGETKLKCE